MRAASCRIARPGRPGGLFRAAALLALLACSAAVSGAPVGASPAPAASVQALAGQLRGTPNPQSKPWAILDKREARLYLFDASGTLQASTPVLLGAAVGDDSAPGIGDRPIAAIRPSERTTPAGRFDTEPGLNQHDEDIVWVDYDAAISMHRVRDIPGDRRLQRLASATAADNRISYGCINVPARFYDTWIKPGFGRRDGVLFVLPETRTVQRQFGARPAL